MIMRKNRGLRLGRRLVKVFKWWVNGRPPSRASKAMLKICNWGHLLKNRAKRLTFFKNNSAYMRVGSDHIVEENNVSGHVPKGHLAVYVGDKEDEKCRVLVPVIYINHPLFGELLKEAEMVYGFEHHGGIKIPCRKDEFENVRKRIAASSGGGRCRGQRSCIMRYLRRISSNYFQ
ncbi:hypothetical protein LIER_22053 [Lithospermum erythrorhizon]|uniref:Uncharacterized protein n=1 Tax=Lithospermum erythrorhizon TaxID=34254 RepID=A0AAV3QVM2_LITER